MRSCCSSIAYAWADTTAADTAAERLARAPQGSDNKCGGRHRSSHTNRKFHLMLWVLACFGSEVEGGVGRGRLCLPWSMPCLEHSVTVVTSSLPSEEVLRKLSSLRDLYLSSYPSFVILQISNSPCLSSQSTEKQAAQVVITRSVIHSTRTTHHIPHLLQPTADHGGFRGLRQRGLPNRHQRLHQEHKSQRHCKQQWFGGCKAGCGQQ